MSVFVGVAAYDEADAAEITYISGSIQSNFTVETGTVAVIDKDLTIKNGLTFTVQSGATLTINKDAKVVVDGLADDKETKANFLVENGARVVIDGQLLVGENGRMSIGEASEEVKPGFYLGTFVYGTVSAQKGADLQVIDTQVMKGGVIDVTSTGKKVSSISGELYLMPEATVNIAGSMENLNVYATGADYSKALDEKNICLASVMHVEGKSINNAADASSVKFTVRA